MQPEGMVPFATSDDFSAWQADAARAQIRQNVAWCKARNIPTLTWTDFKERTEPIAIVGGGPSLADTEMDLRDLIAERGAKVIAINDAHDWLMERGIVPDFFAMHEIEPWPNEFLRHANDTTVYYLASFAHPSAFERLEGRKIVLFHSYGGIGEPELLKEIDPGHPIVCGAEAMAIRAINLMWVSGWTDFDMFGVDGCYRPGEQTHAYFDRKRTPMKITCAGRDFVSPYYLARQANDLRRFVENCGHMFTLTTHGDGLVQHLHRTMAPDRYPSNGVSRRVPQKEVPDGNYVPSPGGGHLAAAVQHDLR